MRVLVVTQGRYGQRIAKNIRMRAPADWQVNDWAAPVISENIVDEPELYLPQRPLPADLILHLGESPQAAQLLPALVRQSGARAVVASIDNAAWIPPGLRHQLRRELGGLGVSIVFPEPLCSLNEKSAGFYDENKHHYSCPVTANFARHFGRPRLDLALDKEGRIKEARVLRGSPCGSTEYTARRIVGLLAEGAVPRAGLMCLHYPCLASMQFAQTEHGVDTIMHTSGRVFNEAVTTALEEGEQQET